MKVYLRPALDKVLQNTGIGRVLHAQMKYLPAFGIQFTDDWREADIRAGHTNLEGIPDPDVIFTHGLYWNGDPWLGRYTEGNARINRTIIDECLRARAITVPSPWVARCWQRDCRAGPTVIGHGLDLHEWRPGTPGGYLLWNKSRIGDVCDPTPAYEMARRGVPVVSTFAPEGATLPANMSITGHLTHPDMVRVMAQAEVYLATTKETFGISTIEALACGVPVLGYRWGGTADLIEHQVTGYLVEPHDLDGLREGWDWLRQHRAEIQANCLAEAQRYDWPLVIGQYARLFERLIADKAHEPTGVSVIVTNWNYAEFLPECLDSVLAQTRPADEIIVVDDGSTDDSLAVLEPYRERVRVIAQANGGVASARNAGARAAGQPFLTFLDADDRLDPHFIEALLPPLQADRGLGIAFSRIGFIPPDPGLDPSRPIQVAPWAGSQFDFLRQAEAVVPPVGQIPSACMFRRDLWQRAGGVKQDYAPGEDSEFWTRGLACGFRARGVDDRPLFLYRNHRRGAHVRLAYGPTYTWNPWMVDQQWPMGAPTHQPVVVRSYSEPALSVIVLRPDLRQDWVNTLDKLYGQDFLNWEALVVTETTVTSADGDPAVPGPTPLPPAYRACTLTQTIDSALRQARAPLVVVVDDHYTWRPDSLTSLLHANLAADGRLLAGEGLLCTSIENARQLSQQKDALGSPHGTGTPIEVLMACGCKKDDTTTARQAAIPDYGPDRSGLRSSEFDQRARIAHQKAQEELRQVTTAPIAAGLTRMRYTGTQAGAIPFAMRDGTIYKGAGQGRYQYAEVPQRHVAELMQRGWQVVAVGQAERRTRSFHYTGLGALIIQGDRGQTLGTVSNRPNNNFIRLDEDQVAHVLHRYGQVLEEVTQGQGSSPAPVVPPLSAISAPRGQLVPS